MNLEEYQQAWKTDSAQMHVAIDTASLSREVQDSQQSFRSVIFWRDVREAGTSLILIPIWFVLGAVLSLPWTWYLTVPALVWVCGFILIDRRRHPQRPSEPGEPLLYYAKESLTQVEHQIWLLRNVFWWYLLPFCISIFAFFTQVAWETSGGWFDFVAFLSFLSFAVLTIYWGVYWLNQRAVRDCLNPRRNDLQKLVDHLEGDTEPDDDGDIMELVAAIKSPGNDVGLNQSWAENWNRLVPSWRVVAFILSPTLVGAGAGLWSGLRLQIPEMGPTLFQAVVGAVIPFEIALGWVIWNARKTMKQKSNEGSSESAGARFGDDETEVVLADESRLPRAPALVILVMIFFLSLMAIVALVSFVSQVRGDSAERDSARLNQPEFGDVSELGESEIAQIDAWLESQLDLAKYPSLTVAVVRDGEVVYGRALGFEDIRAEKRATLQTPYHVASVTKVFTATVAMILHQQGVIDIDAPVIRYLPAGVVISTNPDVGATITFRQLASHASGLPRGIPGRVQSVEGYYDLEPQRLYDQLAQVKLESTPGTKEHYSNLGFGLLGHALARAADKPLEQLVDELICQPLKLSHTAIQADGDLHHATGYDDSGLQRERTHSFRERLAGSGGLVASAEDLAIFLSAQMKPGVFPAEMLEELHSRTWLNDRLITGTGLGWSIGYDAYVGRIIEKNGGRSNCSAWIGFAYESKVGVVVLTNCGGPDVDSIGRWLLDRTVADAYRPVTKHGSAKATPYTGVRWEQERPVVRVEGQWSPLVSIDGIAVERIMEFANKEHGAKAKKRFAEDLIELLNDLGHAPDWEVTLELEQPGGETIQRKALMTEDNRFQARRYGTTNP